MAGALDRGGTLEVAPIQAETIGHAARARPRDRSSKKNSKPVPMKVEFEQKTLDFTGKVRYTLHKSSNLFLSP